MKDGTTFNVNVCYSNFSRRIMHLSEMIKWGLTDHDGCYEGEELEFLISCLVLSDYLEKKPDPMPIRAIFC